MKLNKLSFFFLYLTALYLFRIIIHIACFGLYKNSVFNTIYFFGLKIIPFAFIGLYYLYPKLNHKRNLDLLSNILIFSSVTVAVFFTLAWFTYGGPEWRLANTGLDWNLISVIEWTSAVFIMFLVTKKKMPIYQAFTFAFVAMYAAGFIYEIPLIPHWFNTGRINNTGWSIIHRWYPLMLNSKIVATFLLVPLLLNEHCWKPNMQFTLTFTVLVVFSSFYYLFGQGQGRWLNGWLPRIPTILMMLTLPSGFQHQGGETS